MSHEKFPGSGGRDAFERSPSAPEIVAEEFITGKLHPEWHGESPEPQPPKVRNMATALEREIEDILSRVPGRKEQGGPAKDAPERPKTPPARERDDDR